MRTQKDPEQRPRPHRRTVATIGSIALIGAALAGAWWAFAPTSDAPGPSLASTEPASLGARLRLASRLARAERLDEARAEAAAALALAPGLSVRRWAQKTYAGTKRQEDIEAEILVLTSLGLPEHGPPRPR